MKRRHRVKVMAKAVPGANEMPWDTPGLEPRQKEERCANHYGHCAYRDDDPNRCPWCHRPWMMTSGGCRDEANHAE